MAIKLDLEESVLQQIAQQLGMILADLYILYVKTQNFHWNIVDPRFFFLHEFLEDQYEHLAKSIDEVAERIRMLGQRSPGSLKQFLDMTSLNESDGDLNGDEMLTNLLRDHESLSQQVRDRIEYVSKLRDEGTADLLIDLLRFHEKTAWMLRSHSLTPLG
jgi:starvation-inducible DNA-binding protein